MTLQELAYFRRYLLDNGTLWSDSYIEQIAEEAENHIATEVNCIVDRFPIESFDGIPVYTIPIPVIGIRRITWRGEKIDPITSIQAQIHFPLSGVFVQNGAF